MFKVDLEKAKEPEIKLPTSARSWKKQESSRKTSTLLATPNPLTNYNGDHHFNILAYTYSFSFLFKRKLIHKTVEN